jgi:hypothetical protein
MVLIDPEEVSLAKFDGSPWIWQNRGVLSTGEEIEQVFTDLLEDEKERRRQVFKRHR